MALYPGPIRLDWLHGSGLTANLTAKPMDCSARYVLGRIIDSRKGHSLLLTGLLRTLVSRTFNQRVPGSSPGRLTLLSQALGAIAKIEMRRFSFSQSAMQLAIAREGLARLKIQR